MNYTPASDEVKKNIEEKLLRYFGVTSSEATVDQAYKAAAMTIKDILTEKEYIILGQFMYRALCSMPAGGALTCTAA